MADFSGYIRLQDGTDKLFWNEIDIEGVPAQYVNQFLGWNDWTVFQMIFYIYPPSIPVPPGPTDPPTNPPSAVTMKRTNYFISDRVRVFRSDRTRVFTA